MFSLRRPRFCVGLVLVSLTLLLLTGCQPGEDPALAPRGEFALDFITVGKGDAFLLETPEGQTYLIDTGKAQDYVQIARSLRVLDISSLQGIFLTHGHKDHAGGLQTLLQAFPTETVYYWDQDVYSYREIFPQELAPKYGAKLLSLESGQQLMLGGITAQVFLPPEPDPDNENNNSLILMLTHGDVKFLMMGDAELEEEAQLMASPMDLRADVLKLGHHGEDDSTSQAFLSRVQPRLGLIAGNLQENPESLDPEITERLRLQKVKTLYSDSDVLGYRILSDGENIQVNVLKDRTFPRTLSLEFDRVDRKNQSLSILNTGSVTADLSGCLIRSVKKDEMFVFPQGTCLEAGKTITVSCRDSSIPGDLIWDADSVFQKKKDEARLYDSFLNELARDLP